MRRHWFEPDGEGLAEEARLAADLTGQGDDLAHATRRLTGANIVAALRIAARLGQGKTVATLIVDSGLRYLSTDVFRTGG